MKKFFALCGLAFMMLLAFPMLALAQDGSPGTDPTGLISYFESLAALVPLVILIMGFIKKAIRIEGLPAQILTWVISIGLCYGGWLLKWGLFADITTWWLVLIYGFSAGLAANGFFKIEFITTFLTLIGLNNKPSPKRY